MIEYYDAPKKVLKFASENFTQHYAFNVRGLSRKSLGHWLFNRAANEPDKKQVVYFEENGYEYGWWALYESNTDILHTNIAQCPGRAWHHNGEQCQVCGKRG